MSIELEIKGVLPDLNQYLAGFADMKELLRPSYPYRYAVVIGKKLDDRIGAL